jgi:hypothetical protein
MTRDHAQYNGIYDPATVKMKCDLTQKSRMCIPLVFDLKEREVIYTDLTIPRGQGNWRFNNVEANFASIVYVLRAVTDLDNKPNLYRLFALHAAAHGRLTGNPLDADVVFSHRRLDIDQTNITPYDINKINSQFLQG